jgi:hypothetical protein
MRSHPLSAVGAVVRRRAALQPTGLELFFLNPTITTSSSTTSSVAGAGGAEAGGGGVQRDAGAGSGSGPTWGASSAFFSFRWAETQLATGISWCWQQLQPGPDVTIAPRHAEPSLQREVVAAALQVFGHTQCYCTMPRVLGKRMGITPMHLEMCLALVH